jgi:hypothetical protein
VGSELLVFGRELTDFAIWKSWNLGLEGSWCERACWCVCVQLCHYGLLKIMLDRLKGRFQYLQFHLGLDRGCFCFCVHLSY